MPVNISGKRILGATCAAKFSILNKKIFKWEQSPPLEKTNSPDHKQRVASANSASRTFPVADAMPADFDSAASSSEYDSKYGPKNDERISYPVKSANRFDWLYNSVASYKKPNSSESIHSLLSSYSLSLTCLHLLPAVVQNLTIVRINLFKSFLTKPSLQISGKLFSLTKKITSKFTNQNFFFFCLSFIDN